MTADFLSIQNGSFGETYKQWPKWKVNGLGLPQERSMKGHTPTGKRTRRFCPEREVFPTKPAKQMD